MPADDLHAPQPPLPPLADTADPAAPVDDGTHAPIPASPRASRLAWLTLAALLVLTALVIGIGAGHQAAPPTTLGKTLTNVEIITLKPQAYDDALVLPAKLLANHEATVSAEQAGTLAAWKVDEGATVQQGDVIAELDTATLNARLAELQAMLASAQAGVTLAERNTDLAKAGLEQAQTERASAATALAAAQTNYETQERNYNRMKDLADQQIASGADLDNAKNAQIQAQATRDHAKDALAQATLNVRIGEVRVTSSAANIAQSKAMVEQTTAAVQVQKVALTKSVLKAPISGRLDKHLVQPGEVVTMGLPLSHLYDVDTMRVQVDVADRYAPLLDEHSAVIGQFIKQRFPNATRQVQATVTLPGLPKLTGGNSEGLSFPATIDYISQAADPLSNTFRVELVFPNLGGALKQGIIGEVRLTFLHYDDALVVPLRAIQVSDLGPRVLVVEERQVKATLDEALVSGTAITTSTYAAVRNIVPAAIDGDKVHVTDGLKPGDRIIVAGGKGLVDGQEVQVLMADGKLKPIATAVDEPSRAGAPAPTRAPAPAPAPAPTRESATKGS